MPLTLAKRALQLNLASGRRGLPPLILMTDWVRLKSPLDAAAALPRGSAVILRDYENPRRADLARALRAVCRRCGILLLIGADTALARAVGADGIHYPEALVPRAGSIERPKSHWIVTAAAHSAAGLARARRAGADAAILAPVFKTGSHPGRPNLGPTRFAALVRSVDLPVYALGGVNDGTAARLLAGGAVGIAAVGALGAATE